MTYFDICTQLGAVGIEKAVDDAALLLEHFCGVSAAELMFRKRENFESPMLEQALTRRMQREPLQYILGEWEFFGLPFAVGPDCLIPRPDTELLCELALSLLPQNAYFADFCTGSGCIAVAVLANRPDLRATMVDAFEGTLAIAAQNSKKNPGKRNLCAPPEFIKPYIIYRDSTLL